MIVLILFVLFILLVRISINQPKDFKLALMLFFVASAAKVMFLLFWVFYKTGGFDLNYLQFVDEFFYVRYSWGDPIASFGNAYCVITYVLQRVGFSYLDLKVLNIFATSLALVRLYSLHDLVQYKKRYYSLLLIIGAILHIHVSYYSIFILKDALIFLFSMELLVQMIRRKSSKRSWPIIVDILILTQLRFSLVYLFGIFLFDSNWRISKARLIAGVFAFVVFSGVFMTYTENVLISRFRGGLHYKLDMSGEQPLTKDETVMLLKNNPRLFGRLAISSAKLLFLPLGQANITDRIIVLVYYAVFIYFICIKKIGSSLRTIWPILIFPFAFLVINFFTYINIRWVIYPVSTFLYSLVFLASRPFPAVLPRYMESRRRALNFCANKLHRRTMS